MSGFEHQSDVGASVSGATDDAAIEAAARQKVDARMEELSTKSIDELRDELKDIAVRQAAAAERIRINSENFKTRLDAILAGVPADSGSADAGGVTSES